MDRSTFWLRAAWNDFLAFLPDLLWGLAILVVGYFIARLLASIARPLLHRVGFDRLVDRLGIAMRADRTEQGSRWGASIVFWVTMLIVVMYAADVWRLGAVAAGIAAIIAYLPHVLAAAVIFGAALLFANWVRARMLETNGASVPGETPTTSQRPLVAGAIRAGILALGAFMALRELQIAEEIVTLAFSLTLGAIALAAALAFGLGSRDVAGRVARRWYEDRLGKRATTGASDDEHHIITPP
ncbi:mechanosensitive ion channel family protein [Polyangium mundeleinium]|uniref:Mechanosensitive ion channel family protein n=1 Tax=Polyangium mundeleinium TaxID=2995306 RepID=A0ABT5EKU3_9BACT|nr:hypothetical protein [Polyangium mundeleinium]MDC0742411.1 hypothetical protein [Polyangium mundeleinium]